MQKNIRRTAGIMTNDSTGDYKNRNQKKARKHASYKKQDRSKKHKNISLNPFVPNAPFIYPLKTSENLTVF